jgi:deoxycytidylate deaminase
LWLRAIQTAQNSEYPKIRVGAAIGKGRRVLAAKPNDHRTHPDASEYYTRSRHAEFEVLRCSSKGDTIAVARLSQDGKIVDSKPCPKCMDRILNSPVRWVIYLKGGTLIKEKVA